MTLRPVQNSFIDNNQLRPRNPGATVQSPRQDNYRSVHPVIFAQSGTPAGGRISYSQLRARLALLKGKSRSEQQKELKRIANMGTAMIPLALRLLGDKGNATVRWAAAIILGYIGQPERRVLTALGKTLKDRETLVRKAAATVIAGFALNMYYMSQSTRTLASRALAVLESPLVGALKDTEWEIRLLAASTLGTLVNKYIHIHSSWKQGGVKAVTPPSSVGRKVVPALIKLLGDRQWQVRYMAIAALSDMGRVAKPAKPAIQHLSKHDPNQHVRKRAAITLLQNINIWK